MRFYYCGIFKRGQTCKESEWYRETDIWLKQQGGEVGNWKSSTMKMVGNYQILKRAKKYSLTGLRRSKALPALWSETYAILRWEITKFIVYIVVSEKKYPELHCLSSVLWCFLINTSSLSWYISFDTMFHFTILTEILFV